MPGIRPPGGPNSFIFMQFSAKKLKSNSTFGSWHTPLGKILDPPLTWVTFWVCLLIYYMVNQWQIQDFSEEGAPTPQEGCQHTILPNFSKICMKLKEFGPPGGCTSLASPLRSATVNVTETFTDILKHYFLQTSVVKFAKCML